MTGEEAIEILKTDSCMDCGVGAQSPCTCEFDGHCDIKDATEMAIKALEQETVSKESYDHEYFLRKELDFKVARLEKQIAEQKPCEDAISRTEVIDELNRLGRNAFKEDTDYDNFFAFLDGLPPVTPTNGTCKDCKHCQKHYGDGLKTCLCKKHSCNNKKWSVHENFYCADAERRE